MTFQDWVEESIERYKTKPFLKATKVSAYRFWRGIVRRTYDPWIGTPIWDRGDWDILVIMDACRVDQLEAMRHEYDSLPYETPSVWSNASASIDWINRNFVQHPDELEDTAYLTANPFAEHNDPDTRSADLTTQPFAHLELLYQKHWQDIGNGIETVPPEPMTDHAIHAWRNRDDLGFDRMVVHYMQPHEPFRSRPEWGNGDHKLLKNLVSEDASAGSSVYPLLREGEIGLDEFWRAYQDNLTWVMDDVTERLLENVDGTVVLSSDHGNGLGEFGGSWHHPPAAMNPHIRKVPWVQVECEDSRSETPEMEQTAGVETGETGPQNGSDIDEQLEALGYK